jgi:hypothetical protein
VGKFCEEMRRALRQEATIAMAERGREAHAHQPEKPQQAVTPQGEKPAKSKRKKNPGAPVILEQWIEVEVQDGRAVTKLYPSDELLLKQAEKMEEKPDLVYRRLHFPHGIPAEYSWVAAPSDAERRERGGAGLQRMTFETWLAVIAREAASVSRHVGPTGVGNLPRPMQRGGCDCKVCAHNRELLEGHA